MKTRNLSRWNSVLCSIIFSICALSSFADVTGVITTNSNSELCISALEGRSFSWKVLPSQETGSGIVGAGGAISFPAPVTGTRDICIKVDGALSVKLMNISMSGSVNLGQISISLPDIGNDDAWDDFDLNEINGGFGNSVTPGSGGDFNCDGVYDDFDLNQINGGFGNTGGCYGVFTNEIVPGEMVYIPAGNFLMGNRGNEPASFSDEFPQHSVFVSGFWIGKYEVTRAEYRQFMDAGGYSNSIYWSTDGWNWKILKNRTGPYHWEDSDWGTGIFTQTDNHPIVGVTYYEAEAYCNWAGGRLPTEAEWEKAARWDGNYPRTYTWGDTWNDEYCNTLNDSNPAGGGYNKYQTAPVGSYPTCVSHYGCYDMTGNVLEICKDWYGASYYSETPAGGFWDNPEGPLTGTYRVVRGGGHYYPLGSDIRCATRKINSGPGSQGSVHIGIRLVK